MASGYCTGRGSVHWLLECVVTLDAQAALQLTETMNPVALPKEMCSSIQDTLWTEDGAENSQS